ncbi:hypothetical protein J6590_103799 [Homalodisca vitripennis]|nr:hypothetical protein J6590_103799 [Homalodisca vitripennis]
MEYRSYPDLCIGLSTLSSTEDYYGSHYQDSTLCLSPETPQPLRLPMPQPAYPKRLKERLNVTLPRFSYLSIPEFTVYTVPITGLHHSSAGTTLSICTPDSYRLLFTDEYSHTSTIHMFRVSAPCRNPTLSICLPYLNVTLIHGFYHRSISTPSLGHAFLTVPAGASHFPNASHNSVQSTVDNHGLRDLWGLAHPKDHIHTEPFEGLDLFISMPKSKHSTELPHSYLHAVEVSTSPGLTGFKPAVKEIELLQDLQVLRLP